MPLYYFNIRNGSTLDRDPEGADLPNIDAVRTEALRLIRELWSDVPPSVSDNTVLEVMDAQNRIVLVLPFAKYRPN